MLTITNEDNMALMARYPDKYFDWACIDPPYGLGKRLSDGGGKLKNTPMASLYRDKDWDVVPELKFWREIFRVSKNQIIFGANYFLEYLPNTRGFVCWDKQNDLPTMSACELVWTSLDKPSKIARCSSQDLNRFHPTQKPIYIYKYMFEYCKIKENMNVIDTHLGSGSIAIAAHDYKINLTACELDPEYYVAAMKRIERHTSQTKLF